MKKLTLTICALTLIMASLYATGTPVPEKKAKTEKQVIKQTEQQDLQRLRASISFTDACGNELTITGTCESCVTFEQWGAAFDNWWSNNSTNGCINEEWLP